MPESLNHSLPWTDTGGVVPAGWSVSRLRSCLRSSPRYGINAPAVPYNEALPTYLRITDISSDNQFKPSQRVSVRHSDADKYYLSEGDIVFARTGSVGKSYLYDPNDGDLVFAGYLICVTPDASKLEPRFLAYFAQSSYYFDWIDATSSRSVQPGINGKEFADMQIFLPSISEQRAIVDVLFDVDLLLKSIESLIVKKHVIKRATMQQLLTGNTRLLGFESEWVTRRFGDTIEFLPTASSPRHELSGDGTFEYIHYGDVHACEQSVLHCTDTIFPRIRSAHAGNSAKIIDGDLVMVDASEDLEGIGKSVEIHGISDRSVIAGLHTILCRGRSEFWAMGFKAYLQFLPEFRIALTRAATGISVYAISKKTLAGVEFRMPQRLEQEAIVSVLSAMDAEIEALDQQRNKIRNIKQGALQQLLTGRTRLAQSSRIPQQEQVP